MEGKLPPRSLIPGAPYGALDLETSVQLHQENNQPHPPFHYSHQQPVPHHHLVHPPMHDMFPLAANPMQDFNGGKDDRGKSCVSDEDGPCLAEDGQDGHHGRGKTAALWHRVKWTSNMVRLLVTAVSYIDEDVDSDVGGGRGRRNYAMLKKKGKWRLVSNAMSERGFSVSPQQCEDKFNDLNKRYKRLTDILGRGTACRIVENPALLDRMTHLSDKLKDDARKILSSKHLHYEEMCSYHNRNRLCLLDDPVLQRSLHLALRSRDEHDHLGKGSLDDIDGDDQLVVSDEDDDFDDDQENSAEDHHAMRGASGGSSFLKGLKHGIDHEEVQFGNSLLSHYCMRSNLTEGMAVDMNKALGDGSNCSFADKNSLELHSLQLGKQRLQIQAEMLNLERRHLKWQKFSKAKDRELERMSLENERMKLENERLALELKHKQLEFDSKSTRNQ